MNQGLLSKVVLLASISIGVVTPTVVFAQPTETGAYQPGFWQPRGQIDIGYPIQLRIVNNTEIPLDYQVNSELEKRLTAGGITARDRLTINPSSKSDLERNINVPIYPAAGFGNSQLHFEISADENVVIVAIRPRSSPNETVDKGLYIDEQGRIYAF